jgi:hypothetical protein
MKTYWLLDRAIGEETLVDGDTVARVIRVEIQRDEKIYMRENQSPYEVICTLEPSEHGSKLLRSLSGSLLLDLTGNDGTTLTDGCPALGVTSCFGPFRNKLLLSQDLRKHGPI